MSAAENEDYDKALSQILNERALTVLGFINCSLLELWQKDVS